MSKEQNRIEQIFDQVARKVIRGAKDIGTLRTVLDEIHLQDKTILEVGCGMGDNLAYCVQKGIASGEGFDISGENIKIARAKRLTNVLFHKCSVEEYNTDKKFDLILAWGVFEYFDNPLAALLKMRGFLKEGGSLILLISKPILMKKISVFFRLILSRIPERLAYPTARALGGLLHTMSSLLKKTLYIGESNTYTLEQTIMEGLMVPRYNIFPHKLFTAYLEGEGFRIRFPQDVAPSMLCLIATGNKEKHDKK